MADTIEVPVSLLEKMSRAAAAFADLEDELEDFLLAHDPEFIRAMQNAREQHIAGETRSLDELKRKLRIE